MARGRMVSTKASVDPDLNSLSLEAHLLYMMTLPHLDRDGLIDGNPMALVAIAAPLRPELMQRNQMLINEWVDKGIVQSYPIGRGERVLFFKGFRKHNPGLEYCRETPSIYPPPPGWYRTPAGLVPEDQDACFRLAAAFHPKSDYRKVLIDVANGNIANTSRSSRDDIANTSRLSQSKRSEYGGGGDHSLTPSPLDYGNRGGVGGGDLTDFSDKELTIVAYDFGGQLNLVTEWNYYQGFLIGLNREELIRLIEWIYHYSTQSDEVLSAIKSLPAVIRTHMTKAANAGLTTRQRQEIKELIEKSLRLNEPASNDEDEVDL